MGKLLIDSITRLDRPVVVAYLLVVVSLFILINFLVDVLYSLLDPRIGWGVPAHDGRHRPAASLLGHAPRRSLAGLRKSPKAMVAASSASCCC
jgi:hypothetical protein